MFGCVSFLLKQENSAMQNKHGSEAKCVLGVCVRVLNSRSFFSFLFPWKTGLPEARQSESSPSHSPTYEEGLKEPNLPGNSSPGPTRAEDQTDH